MTNPTQTQRLFRTKPVVIEAWHWDGDADWRKAPIWVQEVVLHFSPKRLIVSTLEGDMTAFPGDWLIKGVKEEVYPCKSDIFEATYEPA